jgi:hypothetical protein
LGARRAKGGTHPSGLRPEDAGGILAALAPGHAHRRPPDDGSSEEVAVAHDTFLERSVSSVPTSAGDVALPVLYRDVSVVLAFFRVDHRRASGVLEGTPFAPVKFLGGGALAGLAAYDYRDTSIGGYREVATTLAVVPRSVRVPALPFLHLLRAGAHADVGWHVLDLPVTTEIADAAGRELWGFPKFTTEIDVRVRAPAVSVAVQAPAGGAPIVTLEGRAGAGISLGALDLVCHTVRGGEVCRTLVEGSGRMQTGLGRGLVLRAGAGDHPMARRLRDLGLDGARPMSAQVCGAYRAVLHAAEPFRPGVARAA